ncbi:MAG: hypothetical protein RLZZ546_2705, partial [Bacteroidota bacterium]
LPATIWKDPYAKFLDPVCKSGVFLREIAARLMKGLEKKIPDVQERANHVFQNQIYGIAITELTSLLSRRSVYCSKKANGKYSIATIFDDEQGNIKYASLKHTWHQGKCTYCGASQEVYDRVEGSESYAYQFIHTDNPEKIFNMKFDVIVGNPPYQLSDGGHGRSAKPLYHKFIEQSKKINPRYLIMIIPDRWFAGGKGLDNFREDMLSDLRFKKLVDFTAASDVFPGADVPGGICYFLWDRDYKGETEIEIRNAGSIENSKRFLNEFNTFIRYEKSVFVLRKINKIENEFMNSVVSSRKPFGLATNDRPSKQGDLVLKYYGGYGKYESSKISVGKEFIPLWKVITSKTSYDHAGQPDKLGKRKVFSTLEVLKPFEICTETYIIVGSFDNEKLANNLLEYLKTKFVRFLVSQLSFSQDITKDRFSFVPLQDFSEQWNDEKLYKKYKLTKDEIAFIDSMIKPMDIGSNIAEDE